ncbi:MAG: hypothetical protein ACXV3D_08620 [Halobacteriota archaeon]
MTEHTDNPANHADSKYMDGLKREITKTLSTLFSDGDVIELRILSNGRVGSGYTQTGKPSLTRLFGLKHARTLTTSITSPLTSSCPTFSTGAPGLNGALKHTLQRPMPM